MKLLFSVGSTIVYIPAVCRLLFLYSGLVETSPCLGQVIDLICSQGVDTMRISADGPGIEDGKEKLCILAFLRGLDYLP